ncbi:MAG: cytidylate kinase-like family protein [Magnetococcales bacterium]|nr:cytidylate kinase-like family protein [Magnetococcales bacterium]
MTSKTIGILHSIMDAKIYEDTFEKNERPTYPLVTVSRSYGAVSIDVARILAAQLHVPLYDKEILTEITRRTKMDRALVSRLDEHVGSMVEDWMQMLFAKKGSTKDEFYYHMVKVILAVSLQGGVIVGRGAHLILSSRRAFRLRVEGSLPICAARLSRQNGISEAAATKLIIKMDKERQEFVKNVYQRFAGGVSYYEMVINSDLYTPEQMARIVVEAMRLSGHPILPPGHSHRESHREQIA